jgi:beta-phosphoglucomutase-like phosphatase (HAD superfamily)
MPEIIIPDTIRGLVFDCDGTLADTHHLHQEAWDECMAALGVSFPAQSLDGFKGVPTVNIIETLNERFGMQMNAQAVAEDKERRAFARLARAEPIEAIVAVARRHKGVLPMAVASGGVAYNVLVTLKTVGLEGFFDAVLTADDPVPGKPNPDIFLLAAERIGVAPEHCLVFEDSPLGIEAARKAGMASIDVNPFYVAL